MTATTVFGIAHRAGGISRKTTASGQQWDAHMIRTIETKLPEHGLEVTLDHDHETRAGQVAYAELDSGGYLSLVSVIDGDWIMGVEEPIFYSAEWDCRGPRASLGGSTWIAERAFLIGAALTTSPGSIEARALQCLPGDVRDPTVRRAWPGGWGHNNPLISRAIDASGWDKHWRPETRAATHIVDRRQRTHDLPYFRGHGRAAGQIEHSAHSGRILSVR